MSSAATIAFPAGFTSGPIHSLSCNLDPKNISNTTATVFVVDDNMEVQQSLDELIRSHGWQPQICDSAREFLGRPRSLAPSAMILSFSSADPGNVEVQKRIAKEYAEMPIIVIADYADTLTTVQAMKAGAVDFLMKPCSAELLVPSIRQSLLRSRLVLDRCRELQNLRTCYALLSPREQQVMSLVVSGLLNKQAGMYLGISEITVKAHRGNVMQKMKAESFAHLVNMASKLRIAKPARAITTSVS